MQPVGAARELFAWTAELSGQGTALAGEIARIRLQLAMTYEDVAAAMERAAAVKPDRAGELMAMAGRARCLATSLQRDQSGSV
jgi:hypothetical protein